MRNRESLQSAGTPQHARPDAGFVLVMALVVVTASWILVTPWVPSIARATMNRFHLRTESFALWAAQQPIPAMYNFANRYEVRQWPAGLTESLHLDQATSLGTVESRYINHFPMRTMTFANTRYRFLKAGEDRWLTITSTYRGQELETRYHVKPNGSGGYELIRLRDRGGLP